MSIPDFQTTMLPLLSMASDCNEHTASESVESLAAHFKLSEDERKDLLPSGTQTVFENRVAWGRSHLKHAGLIESPRRGVFKVTQRGLELLQETPDRIDIKLLSRFPEFIEFRTRKRTKAEKAVLETDNTETPEDQLAAAYQKLRGELESELLEIVKQSSPSFFERLVVDLLVKMGYGGSRAEAGKAIGRSGDEGIDGIINEDKLGLDVIYIQAKRWEGTVGRPEIQKFAGALMGQSAKKGVFITTSSFSKDAINYVQQIDARIILIDGDLLASLMVDHGVGVTTIGTYEIKKADMDYFE